LKSGRRAKAMEKWNLVIDVARCEGCNNCFLSCKDEYVDNDFLPYSVAQPRHGQRWIDLIIKERGQYPHVDVANLPVPCMHCDDAPCVKKAADGEIYKMSNGIVIIDPVKAKGKKELVDACPYGVIWWNEEKSVAQKCTLCAHLLAEGWQESRCVQSCPTGAMRIIKADDVQMEQMIKQENLEVLHPEYKTRPRVYYRNLYRFTRCFIAGDVAFKKDGLIDCAGGASVALFKDSQKINEVLTDNFGDFKFDNLEENSGRYILEIVFKSYKKRRVEVDLTTSKSIGTILL
jgi:Fe-S-cluster-containing dehydrogenase component